MAQLQSTSITGSLIVTGGITGSFSGSIVAPGSTTQVLYNNSGVISADSGFVYNSGNVGIGTASPTAKLAINGNVHIVNSGVPSTGAGIELSYNGGISYMGSYDRDSLVYRNLFFYSADTIFENGGLERMRITSGGNVGIGVSNPGTKLQVNDTILTTNTLNSTNGSFAIDHPGINTWKIGVTDSNSSTFHIGNDSGGSFANKILNITAAGNVGIGTTNPSGQLSGTKGLSIVDATNAALGLSNGTNHWLNYLSSTTYRIWNNTSSEVMTILLNGNIGIGTTSPAQKLHVIGNTAVTGITSTGDRKLSLGILDLNDGGTPTQIRINTTIPLNSPSADFTVNIKGFRYGAPQMVSLSIGWHYYLGSFYNETVISNGAWKPTVTLAQDANGYVVIHLSSPGYWPKLYVESLYSSAYGDTYSSGWTFTDANLSDCTNVEVVPYQPLATDISGNAGSTSAVSGTTNYVSKFASSTTIGNSQIYDNGTNVGIGTTSPSAKLEVSGGDGIIRNAFIGLISAYGGNFASFSHTSRSGAGQYSFLSGNSGETYVNSVNNQPIYFRHNNNDTAIITSTGNVGIGTTSPAVKLHVIGSSIISNNTSINPDSYANTVIAGGIATAGGWGVSSAIGGNAGTGHSWAIGSNGSNLYMGYENGSSTNSMQTFLQVDAGTRNVFLAPSSGDVSIGTSTPFTTGGTAKLTVAGSIISLGPSNGDLAYFRRLDAGKFQWQTYNSGNTGEIHLQPYGGNVGIGTASPSNLLSVAGNAILGQGANRSVIYDSNGGNFRITPNAGGWATGYLFNGSAGTFRGGFGGYGDADSLGYFWIGDDYNIPTMIIQPNQGNVGIGTTNPSNKLDVAGNIIATSGNIYSYKTSGEPNISVSLSGNQFYMFNNSGAYGLYTSDYGTILTRDKSTGLLNIYDRIFANSAGEVGVGTSTPLLTTSGRGNVTINGSSSAIGVLAVGGTWASYWYAESTGVYLAANGSRVLSFETNNAERMRISTAGAIRFNNYGSGTFTGTVAYNLAVDSSGNVIETAGGVVDGSGTANYIPKWSDSNTIGNSVIYESSSNIGIGTTTPGAKLEVNGSFRATTKSFIIDHPTKENKKLQYGVLEGPEHSVYVRGKLTNTNVIQLPDYWHALIHEYSITVNLTAIGKKQDLWVEEITDTYVTIASETGDINCFYNVFAERKDVEKLVTEFDKE